MSDGEYLTVTQAEDRSEISTVPSRFSNGVIAFHWISALIVLTLIGTGWWMLELIRDPMRMKEAFPLFQLHKSLGFLVLALTLCRIVVRWRSKAPLFPTAFADWERLAAFVAQASFYILLLAIPITGWLYISTEWAESLDKEFKAPTLFFGQVAIPYIAPIAEAGAELRRTLSFRLSGAHGYLAYAMLGLVALHIAAAMKHHFFNRDNVLAHMVPGLGGQEAEKDRARPHRLSLKSRTVWLIAASLVALVTISGWSASAPPPRQAVASAPIANH